MRVGSEVVRVALTGDQSTEVPSAERFSSSVPDMFNSLGVQVPCTA